MRDSIYLPQETISLVSNPFEIHIKHRNIPNYFPGGFDNQTQQFQIPHQLKFCFENPMSHHHISKNDQHSRLDYYIIENALLDIYSILKHSFSQSRLRQMQIESIDIKSISVPDDEFRNDAISAYSSEFQSFIKTFDEINSGRETSNHLSTDKSNSTEPNNSVHEAAHEKVHEKVHEKGHVTTHETIENTYKDISNFYDTLQKESFFQAMTFDMAQLSSLFRSSTSLGDAMAIDSLFGWMRISTRCVFNSLFLSF